jgi:glycosyltransferase involved in cell wall biosynthesis
LVIHYKTKTPLIEKFCEEFEHTLYTPPTLTQKWGFGKGIQNPDIFFHTGVLLSSDLELMLKSSKIIVQSHTIKHDIVERSNGDIKNDQIEVIYPPHNIEKFKKKEFRKAFKDRYNLDKKTKLIYFTGKNYEKTGLIHFLNFVSQIGVENFKAIISGTPEQLKAIVPLLSEMNIQDRVILSQDDLFRAADIFVLPTSNKTFASNVLKAMACKCVVFAPSSNHAFELLDNFAIMNSVDDPATVFKIEMLLNNPKEIKVNQKLNYKKAKLLSFENQYNKLKLALNLK